jgi:hypothetical protein
MTTNDSAIVKTAQRLDITGSITVVKIFVETGGSSVEGRGGEHISKKYEERRDFLRNSNALKLIIVEGQHQSGCTYQLT